MTPSTSGTRRSFSLKLEIDSSIDSSATPGWSGSDLPIMEDDGYPVTMLSEDPPSPLRASKACRPDGPGARGFPPYHLNLQRAGCCIPFYNSAVFRRRLKRWGRRRHGRLEEIACTKRLDRNRVMTNGRLTLAPPGPLNWSGGPKRLLRNRYLGGSVSVFGAIQDASLKLLRTTKTWRGLPWRASTENVRRVCIVSRRQ